LYAKLGLPRGRCSGGRVRSCGVYRIGEYLGSVYDEARVEIGLRNIAVEWGEGLVCLESM